MARNRTIYQTEAIYVSDNTRSITKSEHKNISRVQSANYGFSINRERVNQYGQLGEIDSIVVEAPNVDFEMSYYLTNGDNEYFLNLDTGYGGFLKNQIISSGQNIYVVNVPEGKDVQDQNWDNFSVIGIGNAFVTDYTVDFGVGQMSRVNVGFSALNISSQINLSKVSGELIGIENAGINPISGVKYTDPITIAPIVNNSGQSAIRPSDTSITITPTKTLGDNDSISVLSTLDEKAHIQTASLNIALDRTSLQRLGSNFAYAKVVEPPTTATVSISAIVNEIQSSSLSDILDHSNEYTIEIESVDPDGYQLCKYSLVGAKLDSESFGSAIGSNKVVDLTFTTQLGGIGQTNYNMFFEKYGFLDFFPSAAAAYSLRNLTADFDQKIVRVRRESDNSERDFTEYDIKNGTMVDWVNKQVIRPLDIRELDDANGNRPDTNDFIDTPAAAYSLRSLGENQANITINDSNDERDGETGKYVVQTRRNVDGATKSFTADEVTDGTLEDFVEGWDLYPARGISETSQTYFNVTKTDDRNYRIVSDLANDGLSDTKFIQILLPQDGLVLGKQRVTFDVDVNSGDISNFMLRLSYRDDQTNLQPVAGSNSFEFVITDDGASPAPQIYFAIHEASSFDVTISNLKVYKSTVNELPLDQTISYSSVTFSGTWAEAKAHAEANGGRLAVLDTQQKIDAANKYLLSLGSWGTHWIGLSDIDTEGSFTWISGKELTANQWKDGEPNNFGDEDVVEIVNGDTSTGVRGWNDNKATVTRNFYLFETQESKAAYSLRNLSSSYTGDVVEVRRSSDDAVQSFTASEVANGTLESFCGTEDITSSLNLLSVGGEVSSVTDRSNFTITYLGIGSPEFTALRSNSTLGAGTYKLTGTIVATNLSHDVQFRSAGGGSTYQSSPFTNGTNVINETFTLTGDPNNLTIYAIANATGSLVVSNLKLEQISCDGRVKTWYDQSGSDNHAVQTTPANQPTIVEGGSLLESNNMPEVRFDGTDDYLALTTNLTAQPYSTFSVYSATQNESYIYSGGTLPATGRRITGAYIMHHGAVLTGGTHPDAEILGTYLANGVSSEIFSNGTSVVSGNAGNTSDTIQYVFGRPANAFGGTAKELIIYNSDQSTKRRAIEENIANHYDISLAAFSRDGTVSTWYDQSGNTNDATQTDPTKQPKIVDGGTYLEEVDFNGTSHYLDLSSPLGSTTEAAVFTVAESGGGTDNFIIDNRDSGGDGFRLFKGGTQLKIDWQATTISNGSPTADEKFVGFAGHDSANLSVGVDGGTTAQANTSTINVATAPRIGARSFTSPSGYWDGTINELIIYNSDQSANRTAIEANISEHYGIVGIPAFDNEVNGFVQTWYDQSGEGRNGEQDTAANQPKIVVNGVLQKDTDGNPYLKFEGSQYLKVYKNGSLDEGLILPDIQNTFSVSVTSSTTDDDKFLCQANRSLDRYYLYNNKITIGDSQTVSDDPTINTKNVRSVTANFSGLFALYLNSSLVGTKSYTGSVTGGDSTIGAAYNGGSAHEGSIYELVFYRSDQSSNRPAIEANIANHYGITLS